MNDSGKARGPVATSFLYNLFYYKKRRSVFCCLGCSQEGGVEQVICRLVDFSFIPSALEVTIIDLKHMTAHRHGYKVMPTSAGF